MKFYTSVIQHGNRVLVRGYDDSGNQVKKAFKYKPYLYRLAKDGDYRTLDGQPCVRKDFKSIYGAKDYIKQYADTDNVTIYGYDSWAYTFINDLYDETPEYDQSLIRVANIDIEVASDKGMPDIEVADNVVTAITLKMGKNVLALGMDDFIPPDKDVTYIKCDDEIELLERFLEVWEYRAPDVVTGWYIEGFDIPYLVNRIRRMLNTEDTGDNAERLSPWKILKEREVYERGKMTTMYFPVGVAVLDYMRVYKKFILDPRDSYKLDYIASVEVGARKTDYSEYENLFTLYKENHQLFMEYNVNDVRLVDKLEDKLKLLQLVYWMAYDCRCNLEDVLSPVRYWEIKSYHMLIKDKIVFPPKEDNHTQALVGGFVKHPDNGMYEWICSLDLNSLYPHLMMQFNISPETLVSKWPEHIEIDDFLSGNCPDVIQYAKDHDLIVAGNGCFYRRDIVGFLPKMMQTGYDDRVVFKGKMLDAQRAKELTKDKLEIANLVNEISRNKNAQSGLKVALNSAYGATANKWFRFYNHHNAEAVTTSGQLAINWIEKHLNAFMNRVMKTTDVNYVIAADTDSIYLNMGPLVKKMNFVERKIPRSTICDYLDEMIQKKIEPFIEKSYQELAELVNAPTQKMKMKRESIADVGIWTGKKHYILNILDKEGVRFSQPKVEIKGIESVKSSTPSSCRKKIEEAISIIINGDNDKLLEFIDTFREEFETLPFDEIAFPRGINGMDKYGDEASIFKPRTPIQVRGALVFNHALKEYDITNFQPIYDGDKIKFCYLTVPNAVRSNVISTPSALPKILKLDEKLDRDTQFEKGFLRPVHTILDAIGWKKEQPGNTLERFFG